MLFEDMNLLKRNISNFTLKYKQINRKVLGMLLWVLQAVHGGLSCASDATGDQIFQLRCCGSCSELCQGNLRPQVCNMSPHVTLSSPRSVFIVPCQLFLQIIQETGDLVEWVSLAQSQLWPHPSYGSRSSLAAVRLCRSIIENTRQTTAVGGH